MSSEIKSWQTIIQESPCEVTAGEELVNIMALNFCFEVEPNRLHGSDIFLLLNKELRDKGYSCTFYGVGNFGFRLTDHFSILTSDGKIEGHFNDPANDHDIITVTNSDLKTWKECVNNSIDIMRKTYGDEKSPLYFHWAKIENQKWHRSNFDIPDYCSVIYSRPNQKPQSLAEIHWLQQKPAWYKELLSKYAPWYSNRIGFPILNASVVKGDIYAGIWQPLAKEVDKRKPHEVRISVQDNFCSDARDVLQAVRIILGVVQASIAAREPAVLSDNTIDVLCKGVTMASKKLSSLQRENAISRLKTTIHRAKSLQDQLRYFCFVEDCPYPFENFTTATDIITYWLDKISWGENVLGKTVKDFLEKPTKN